MSLIPGLAALLISQGPASAPASRPVAAPDLEAPAFSAAEAALEGKSRTFDRQIRTLKAAGASAGFVGAIEGLGALLLEQPSRARNALRKSSELRAYYAMAHVEKGKGHSRARGVLSKARKDRDADALQTFLAALAFAHIGQPERADELLKRSLGAADSALAETFAPDPAVALGRVLLDELGSTPSRELRMAELLLAHGRRSAALDLTTNHQEADRAREVRFKVWWEVDKSRARRLAEDAPPTDPKWRIRRIDLLWQEGEVSEARQLLSAMTEPPTGQTEKARWFRVRSRLALKAKPKRALEFAEDAARLDPKNDEAVALIAEALLADGQFDRALAFAKELLRRKPVDEDPYSLLARIHAAREEPRRVRALELRSVAHQASRSSARKLRAEREAVLQAVRRAGSGTTGLEAMREDNPRFSLPIDLHLAKHGKPGTARAARDRILAACADNLGTFLSHRDPWSNTTVVSDAYGRSQNVALGLSAADPERCTRRRLQVGGR